MDSEWRQSLSLKHECQASHKPRIHQGPGLAAATVWMRGVERTQGNKAHREVLAAARCTHMRDSVGVEVGGDQVGDELRVPHLRSVHAVLQRPGTVSTRSCGLRTPSPDDGGKACTIIAEQALVPRDLRVRDERDLIGLQAKARVGLIQLLSTNEAEAVCIACDMSVHRIRRNVLLLRAAQ